MSGESLTDSFDLNLHLGKYSLNTSILATEAIFDGARKNSQQEMQCYFTEARSGEKFILVAFSEKGLRYTAKNRGLNSALPGLAGSLFRVTTSKNRNGEIVWQSASLLVLAEQVTELALRLKALREA